MKYCIFIMDGSSGWPIDELGGRTTLEAAHTPNLDWLAQHGFVGQAVTVPAEMEASSAIACMSILGYDPAPLLHRSRTDRGDQHGHRSATG